MLLTTYRFRIKDSTSKKKLKKLASAVNFVWNYINDLSFQNVKKHGRWLSHFDVCSYLREAGKELGLAQLTLNRLAMAYVSNRKTFKKCKLKWRSAKRSLGWIPLDGTNIKVKDDYFTYKGEEYRFYKSRSIPEGAKIKSGSITQDARDRWYASFVVEVPEMVEHANKGSEVGIDLGISEQIALSDGDVFSRPNLTKDFELKLAKAQRAGKKKQTRNIHSKIKNKRLDWTHKITTEIARIYDRIFIGDLKSNEIIEKNKRVSKGILDASPARIISQLEYKAKRLGGEVKRVSECWTTVTCSECVQRTGPSGQAGLSVREWACSHCQTLHNRDVNAARNILRLNTQTLLKEPLKRELL